MNRCRARIFALRLSRSTRSAGRFSIRCNVDTAGIRLRSAAAAPTTSAWGRWVCTNSTRWSRISFATRVIARGSSGNIPSSATGTPARRSAVTCALSADVCRAITSISISASRATAARSTSPISGPSEFRVGTRWATFTACSAPLSGGAGQARSRVVTSSTLSGDDVRPSCATGCGAAALPARRPRDDQAVTGVPAWATMGGWTGPWCWSMPSARSSGGSSGSGCAPTGRRRRRCSPSRGGAGPAARRARRRRRGPARARVVAAPRTRRAAAHPVGGRVVAGRGVADRPAPARMGPAADHPAGARPRAGRRGQPGHGRRAAQPVRAPGVGGPRRLCRVRGPAGHGGRRPGRARAPRRPLQGPQPHRRGDRGQPRVPPRGRRAGPAAGAAGGRGRRAGLGRPGGARRVDEPDRDRPAHRRDAAAALPRVGRPGRRRRAGAPARAQPAPPARLPAQPPLLRRPAAARRRAGRPRLPPQPRARRRQPGVLAGRPARQARGHRVHPPQLRRRRDLQAGRPPVLRLPAGQAVQPGVVHGGRPLAHRQAAPAALRAAGQRRRGHRAGPGRGRLPRAGLDHLRPAARGLGDGRRAGGRAEEGRGRGLAGPLRPRPAGAASARPTCGSRSRSRCATRWPPTPTGAWRCRRRRSRSPSGSTASPRSSRRRWSPWPCSGSATAR